MVTVTLWCGIVGAANGAFSMPIDIDANKSVGALKYEIQHHNSGTITCDASALQLLVDKEDRYKLTEAAVLQGVDARIISGMTCLRFNSAIIKQTCLSRVNERAKLSENDVAEGKTPTDVLVVVPQDAASGAAAALTKMATEQAIMVGGVPGRKKRKAEATALSSLDELVTLAALGRTLDREIDLEVGKTVRVPKHVFGTVFANGLFVRKEYWDLHEMIELELKARGDELVTRVLVTGSPGIGKSVFGVFLLLVFMTERKDVAYLPLKQRSPYYFSWNSTEGHYDISRTPLADKKYEGLFDGEESGDALAFHPFRHVFLFASPRDEHFNHFVKDVCFRVYMNPWSKDECQALADESQLEDQGEWFHRFNLVGGKPRFLFSSFLKYDVLVKRVKGAISHTVNEMEAQIGEFQRQQFGDGMRHMLFLIYRDVNDPSCFFMTFSSLIAERMVIAQYNVHSAERICSLLQTSALNLQSWREREMERYLLERLPTSALCMRSLEPSNDGTEQQLGPFTAASVDIQAASEVQNELALYIPLSESFPAIDAVFVVPSDGRIIYIQLTVAKKHPIQYQALKDVYLELNKRVEFRDYTHTFLFIVSDDTYDGFTARPYKHDDRKDRIRENDINVAQSVGKIIQQ